MEETAILVLSAEEGRSRFQSPQLYKSRQHHVPYERNVHSHRDESLKTHVCPFFFCQKHVSHRRMAVVEGN